MDAGSDGVDYDCAFVATRRWLEGQRRSDQARIRAEALETADAYVFFVESLDTSLILRVARQDQSVVELDSGRSVLGQLQHHQR